MATKRQTRIKATRMYYQPSYPQGHAAFGIKNNISTKSAKNKSASTQSEAVKNNPISDVITKPSLDQITASGARNIFSSELISFIKEIEIIVSHAKRLKNSVEKVADILSATQPELAAPFSIAQARISPIPEPTTDDAQYVFRRYGAKWYVAFETSMTWVDNSLGMTYIALLLAKPNEPLFQSEIRRLAGLDAPPRDSIQDQLDTMSNTKIERITDLSRRYLIPLKGVDNKTLSAIRDRKIELLKEIAEGDTDRSRIEIDEDLEALGKYLKEINKETGKSKSKVNAVGNAIRCAQKAIRNGGLPALARHLGNCIEPFAMPLCYKPEDPSIVWDVDFSRNHVQSEKPMQEVGHCIYGE